MTEALGGGKDVSLLNGLSTQLIFHTSCKSNRTSGIALIVGSQVPAIPSSQDIGLANIVVADWIRNLVRLKTNF